MKDSYELRPDNVLVVCAWCWPGETVFQSHPELAKTCPILSHGICQKHFDEIRLKKDLTVPASNAIVSKNVEGSDNFRICPDVF